MVHSSTSAVQVNQGPWQGCSSAQCLWSHHWAADRALPVSQASAYTLHRCLCQPVAAVQCWQLMWAAPCASESEERCAHKNSGWLAARKHGCLGGWMGNRLQLQPAAAMACAAAANACTAGRCVRQWRAKARLLQLARAPCAQAVLCCAGAAPRWQHCTVHGGRAGAAACCLLPASQAQHSTAQGTGHPPSCAVEACCRAALTSRSRCARSRWCRGT